MYCYPFDRGVCMSLLALTLPKLEYNCGTTGTGKKIQFSTTQENKFKITMMTYRLRYYLRNDTVNDFLVE